MPFFGKKKSEKESSKKEKSKSGASYPTAPSYPRSTSQASYPTAADYPRSTNQGTYNDPPPPYSQQAPQFQQQMYQQPPGFMPPSQMSSQAGPSTATMPEAFDAGARFDLNGPSIPPPPPGMMPTATQIAAAQGQNVVATQKPKSFWTGGSGGGYVFW